MATKIHENNGCAVYTSVIATSVAGAVGSDVIPCAGYRYGSVECSSTAGVTSLTFYHAVGSSTGTKRAAHTTTGGAVSVVATTLCATDLPPQIKGWQYFCMQAAGAGNTALKVVLRS